MYSAVHFYKRNIGFFIYLIPKQFILHFRIFTVQFFLLAFVSAFNDINFKDDTGNRKIKSEINFCKFGNYMSFVFISCVGLDYFKFFLLSHF
ncbi:hypothetical protein FLAVO9AF_240004 [Flavobacterium sp. 9AF]|nr:hypothetical protein FLAVO9AF_240004 [Flavobacterium sp. 9AF]